jgi:hypothetical protein
LCQCHLKFEKGKKALIFIVLVTFFHHKISITLQRMQASSILSRRIAVSLSPSQLSPLENTQPITTMDLLQAISVWQGEIRPTTYYRQSIFYLEGFGHPVWANLTSYKFSIFTLFFLCIFSKSMACLLRKVLQGCIKLVMVKEN